ncbi:hypothetical protein JG687_00017362 [Phytophthora cactorum]|uniref:Uncharacterized protein n=1 Tax=Phytophthora cactorum TaxID=29920 RepID=A0A8T1TRR2_9STRA|nr:hypothetical protein JG687_00017362 [Phytophthora cactorum]
MTDVRTNEERITSGAKRLHFPIVVQNLEERYLDGRFSTSCENSLVEWGKQMSGKKALITLLKCAIRDLNHNGMSTRGFIRQQWRDIWLTSCTLRRAGAQYRYMFAPPKRRWS